MILYQFDYYYLQFYLNDSLLLIIFSYQYQLKNENMISMDYYLQQEYNDSNESDSDNNHLFYLFLIYTRSARIVETSIHSFIFIQIRVIDLDLICWNELYPNLPGSLTVCRLGISIHDSIIQYQTRKSH